ncbi:hypothetical protein [Bifidobacterium eulemuris]|uniref:Tail measure n=1 Tax=Bifidobacterium eulemuris TaxID=1765219 RepID=A0A261GA20_9BIFI|nr:hypothetical protein [Bifidobacterium eulemuris]OZG68281.1 Tail measure [Bifidobacterium eulemuris]QOL31665.1 hypothetical protein BE0216_03705 [Bifidobacterium eulemuris]
MAGNLLSAGQVGVDIVPDTTLFWARLNGELHRRNPEVEVGFVPDTTRVSAEMKRIDSKDVDVDVEFKGDSRKIDRIIKDLDDAKVSPELDAKNMLRQLDKVSKELDETRSKLSWQKYWDKNEQGVEDYNKLLDKSNKLAKEQSRLLETEAKRRVKLLDDYQRAILRLKPLGADNLLDQQAATDIRKRLDKLVADFNDGKVSAAKVRMELDDSSYQHVANHLERTMRDIREVNSTAARVRFYEEGADRLERRLRRLNATHVDIPASIQLDQEDLIKRLRETAEIVRRDPDYVFETNLDLDMRRAEERIKDFQKKNDELKMDLDIETLTARAHLAYFTRPRTIDVFARFRGTDLGKILNGITSGATGLKGVQNQFDKLVNTFDKLDDVVPKLSLVGAAMTTLGAGALNLGRTVGGVGTSLVSLSKAALAAPAVLGGLASAGYGVYAAVKTAGDEFDITKTKLNGLQSEVGTAFWDESRDAIYRMADTIDGKLRTGLVNVAKAEGEAAAGLADLVSQETSLSRLEGIFQNTEKAVGELSPGISDAARAMLDLGDTTSQYLPRAAAYMSDLAEQFANWVERARETGAITQAMEGVIEQAGYLKSSIKDLGGILSGTFGTLAAEENGLEGFADAIHKANDAVQSAKFQETLKAWSKGAQDAQDNMRGSFGAIGDAAYELRDATRQVFGDSGDIIGNAAKNISRVLGNSEQGVRNFSSGVREGFTQVFDAVGDSSDMFDQLLTMVGKLSSTFGGTFANTLRASAPLIESLATAAGAVADAFAALPEPIQAAIGLYATFGKAGINAFDALKTGMMESTLQSIQYRRALAELGVDTTDTILSMRYAVDGFVAAHPSLQNVTNGVKDATGVMGKMGAAAKGAGSALLSAFGGGAGLAITAGVGMAITAYADYNRKASATKQASEELASAMREIPDSAQAAADGIGAVGKAIQANFENTDFGETGFAWLNDLRTGFDDAESAAKELGYSTQDLANIVMEGGTAYENLQAHLADVAQAGTYYGNTILDVIFPSMTKQAKAAEKLSNALAENEKQYRENWEQVAVANGYTAEYADELIDAGESAEALSVILGTTAQRQEMLSKAQQIATEWSQRQADAQKNLLNAMSDYGETYSNMGDAISHVQELVANGEHVWDETANAISGVTGSFDVMSEAGRYAQEAIANLGESGHDLLESMVASGASVDDVNAKQQELAKQLYDTATAFKVPEEAAEQLQKVYGLTPEEVTTLFKAEAEESKQTLTQYLSYLRAIFPEEGNTAVFQTVLEGINSGAIESTEQVYDELQKLTGKDYVTVLDADGDQVRIKKSDADKLGLEFENEKYTTTLDAEDLASGKIEQVIALKDKGLSDRAVTLLLNADGDALWKTENVEKNLQKLGMSQKTYEWLLNGSGTAEERMQKVREELSELNLTDKQIQWILDAVDNASEKMDTIEKNKVPLANGVSFIIEADNQPAFDSMDEVRAYDGKTIAEPWTRVQGEWDGANTAIQASAAYDGVTVSEPWARVQGEWSSADRAIQDTVWYDKRTISQPWGRVLGENNGARQAFRDTAAYDGRTISEPWGRVKGENNSARKAFQDTAWYDKRTISQPWGRVLGDDSNVWNVFRNIANTNGSILATRYVDIVTRSSGTVQAATGGRIYGAGTSTSDSIPAMLSNGEAVLRAASLKKLDAKYGRGWFDYVNRYGDVPDGSRPSATALSYRRNSFAYADGGRVKAVEGMVNVTVNPVVKVEVPGMERASTSNYSVTVNGVGVGSDAQAMELVDRLVAYVGRQRRMR